MNFRTKIGMLPLSAGLVFILGLAISYFVGSQTSKSLQHLKTVDKPALEHVRRLNQGVEQFQLILQAAAAEGDVEKLKDVEVVVDKTRQLLKSFRTIEGKAQTAQQLLSAYNVYQSEAISATQAMLASTPLGDKVQLMQDAQTKLNKLIETTLKQYEMDNHQREVDAEQGVRVGLWVNLSTGIAVLAVLGIASHLIVNSVWRDLGQEPSELQRVTHLIAEGDLQVQPQVATKDSRSLNAAIAKMSASLHDTVDTIREATQSMATASNEIAAGNQDLSVRTEATASSLQMTASSMAQLTGSVHQSVEAAQQANAMASAAAAAAQRGGGIVEQVVSNMDEISLASKKISDIIGVIDSIAFQTNILALNASVEAARAGEQGRGFAVVANEVRTLAHRSAQAAREIKALIAASSEKVEGGARLVQDAGQAMKKIVVDVERVSNIIEELNSASSEQSKRISQVNNAVIQLDEMTQQNSALVEQSAAASASMRQQANRLTDAVSAFRTRRSDRWNMESDEFN